MSTEFKPLTLQELRRFEKLKKYRHNARNAIKGLQRIADMWRQIAIKEMESARAWRESSDKYFHMYHALLKEKDLTK